MLFLYGEKRVRACWLHPCTLCYSSDISLKLSLVVGWVRPNHEHRCASYIFFVHYNLVYAQSPMKGLGYQHGSLNPNLSYITRHKTRPVTLQV